MISLVLGLIFSFLGTQAACLSGSLSFDNKMTAHQIRLVEETVQQFESSVVRDLPPLTDLVITLEHLNPRINAEVIHQNSTVSISVLGGMLSHPKMNSSVLLLLLCHELGHFLGGPPLKSRNGWSSTEGQADYYSAHTCVKNFDMLESTFYKTALDLTGIYAEVNQEAVPSMDRCDENIVGRTNFGYPSVQCRLDTLMAGRREAPRPKCWFTE